MASIQVITNIDLYLVQLLNRVHRGSILVPGETLPVVEVAPAAYINDAVNEAEKGTSIQVIQVSSVERFGRMNLSGSESEILQARASAVKGHHDLEGLKG